MQTEVPLSLFPRSTSVNATGIAQTGHNPQKKPRLAADVGQDLKLDTSIRINPHKLFAGVPATPVNVPICPPPTRSVTPMLSLYATLKVTNIRMRMI